MPPRVVEKMDVIRPNADAADLKRLQKHMRLEHVPPFLGGAAPWPPLNARFAPTQL